MAVGVATAATRLPPPPSGPAEAVFPQDVLFLRLADNEDSGTLAHAMSLLDWNARNPFCTLCGAPTVSIGVWYPLTWGGGSGERERDMAGVYAYDSRQRFAQKTVSYCIFQKTMSDMVCG